MDPEIPRTRKAGIGKFRLFIVERIRGAPFFRFPRGAFTLIELMLVVAIIGLLAAIALPKFASLVEKSREAAAKGALGGMRSAINVMYLDMDAVYVSSSMPGWTNYAYWLVPRYIDKIPVINLSHLGHGKGDGVIVLPLPGTPMDAIWDSDPANPLPWFLEVNVPQSEWTGRIFLNCTHTDTRGVTISLW